MLINLKISAIRNTARRILRMTRAGGMHAVAGHDRGDGREGAGEISKAVALADWVGIALDSQRHRQLEVARCFPLILPVHSDAPQGHRYIGGLVEVLTVLVRHAVCK